MGKRFKRTKSADDISDMLQDIQYKYSHSGMSEDELIMEIALIMLDRIEQLAEDIEVIKNGKHYIEAKKEKK